MFQYLPNENIYAHTNIPYNQSSAKLPVILPPSHLIIQSFVHSVPWSLGHLVTRSLGHSVTQSLGHLVTRSLSHLVTIFNIDTN